MELWWLENMPLQVSLQIAETAVGVWATLLLCVRWLILLQLRRQEPLAQLERPLLLYRLLHWPHKSVEAVYYLLSASLASLSLSFSFSRDILLHYVFLYVPSFLWHGVDTLYLSSFSYHVLLDNSKLS